MDVCTKKSQDLAPFATEWPSSAVKKYQNFEKWPFLEKMRNLQKSITRLLVGPQSPNFACNPIFCQTFSGNPLEQVVAHKKKFWDFFSKHSPFFGFWPMNVAWFFCRTPPQRCPCVLWSWWYNHCCDYLASFYFKLIMQMRLQGHFSGFLAITQEPHIGLCSKWSRSILN